MGFHWEDVAKQQWPTSAGRRDSGRRAQSPSHSVNTVRERQVNTVRERQVHTVRERETSNSGP